jgi:hypothetical protein
VDLKTTYEHWESLVVDCGKWMSVAKYKIAAFYSFHTEQTIPPCPFSEKLGDKPNFILGGRASRWLRNKLKGNHRSEILQSVLQSKKGMPRPTAEMLKEAVGEFLEHITGKPKSDPKDELLVRWSELEDVYPKSIDLVLDKESVIRQLERTVKEIFGTDSPITMTERLKPFFPSTSANYINSRKKGGAVGVILRHPELLRGLRKPGGHITVRHTKVNETDDEIEEEFNEIDSIAMEASHAQLWFRLLKAAKAEVAHVTPVALAESLKTRMITKGPPFLQTVLRSLWKTIHRRLRRHPAFRLIGEPVTEQYVLDRMGLNLKTGEYYLSGDFKAATDNLKSWVSNAVSSALAKCLGFTPTEAELFTRALTGHIFEDGRPQTTGQLMGSIASFPVLCIANAAVCRWALEVATGRVYTLADAPLMINGDDCALRGPKALYGIWQRITRWVGLEESVGKTYFSKNFVNINSTNFERKQDPFEITYTRPDGRRIARHTALKQTRYVNIGLMTGLKRSGTSVGLNDQDDPRSNIGTRARELARLAPDRCKKVVMREFIERHRDILEKTRLPWYIPEWLGGIGLPIGEWGAPSELDLRLARAILLNWAKRRPISLAHKEASWSTWKLAADSLPSPIFTSVKGLGTTVYNDAVGLKCIDLLFDANVDLRTLNPTVRDGGGKTSKAIAKNAKLWTPKRYGSKLPKPLDEKDLAFIALYPNWSDEIGRESFTRTLGGNAGVLD